VGVFVRPFQERHISFGGLVGVLERVVFGSSSPSICAGCITP
jgi:hypothetical protein